MTELFSNAPLSWTPCRWGYLVVLLAASALQCPAAESEALSRVDDPKLSLSMTDIAGDQHALFKLGEDKARVFVFVMNDCPVANIFAPEIHRLFTEYSQKGISGSVIYVDPDAGLPAVKQHAKDYGHAGYPVIYDPQHQVVDATGATQTPEAVVIGQKGGILYRGRIDNRYAGLGQPRRKATETDLRNALDDILAGRPVSVARTKTVGCYIPPRKR